MRSCAICNNSSLCVTCATAWWPVYIYIWFFLLCTKLIFENSLKFQESLSCSNGYRTHVSCLSQNKCLVDVRGIFVVDIVVFRKEMQRFFVNFTEYGVYHNSKATTCFNLCLVQFSKWIKWCIFPFDVAMEWLLLWINMFFTQKQMPNNKINHYFVWPSKLARIVNIRTEKIGKMIRSLGHRYIKASISFNCSHPCNGFVPNGLLHKTLNFFKRWPI